MKKIFEKLVVLKWIITSLIILQISQALSYYENPVVKKALEYLQKIEPETIAEQTRICEIPAPPFKEQARSDYIKSRFVELGLHNVFVDSIGNVIGKYPDGYEKPVVVISAHLDTVFPENTEIKVVQNGNILQAPGIADDSRGLAIILSILRALNHFKIKLPGQLIFVATVGEEGLGNLRGVRHLIEHTLKGKITHFISVDDVGLHTFNKAVGSNRWKVIFRGSGGHSFADFGISNPVHILGRTIAKIANFQVPDNPKTTFSVGRTGGGTSVNSIAHTAWMEIDTRSESAEELLVLEKKIYDAAYTSLEEENSRWNSKDTVSVEIKSIGNRPTGDASDNSDILQAVIKANNILGIKTDFRAGSTDSNIPISLGIKAVTLAGGGDGHYKHSLKETFDTKNSHLGTQRLFLTILNIFDQ